MLLPKLFKHLVLGFEKICGEVAARGSQESELELKYMLDIMYEAGCASWTLLVWNFLLYLPFEYVYKFF